MRVSTINERFRQAREFLGLSQEEFAIQANRTRSEIKNIEYGKTVPKPEVISAVCSAHGISPHWLKTGEGEMRQQRSREEEIGEIAERASTVDPEKARAFFQRALDGFTDAEIMAIYQIMRQRFPGK